MDFGQSAELSRFWQLFEQLTILTAIRQGAGKGNHLLDLGA